MAARHFRKIIKIDEEKCNGCGVCVPACAEGALQIINGKARLVSEVYCDGLGACLGGCPQGAISIEERLAEEFDEEAAMQHVEKQKYTENKVLHACPSAIVSRFDKKEPVKQVLTECGNQPSMLGHWPVQLRLVPPTAAFLNNADVLLVGDCVPFALPDFHTRYLKDNVVLVACPKLDDFQSHLTKLTDIIAHAGIKSFSVIKMEVPCCSGLVNMLQQGLKNADKNIPYKVITIGIKGDLKASD
ncbi:MAG: 4Fe-4S binding protein [Dehalococcoidales bacterium]|nr:4Fe-4S binding protein [Dehalococcoidales bacterium]